MHVSHSLVALARGVRSALIPFMQQTMQPLLPDVVACFTSEHYDMRLSASHAINKFQGFADQEQFEIIQAAIPLLSDESAVVAANAASVRMLRVRERFLARPRGVYAHDCVPLCSLFMRSQFLRSVVQPLRSTSI